MNIVMRNASIIQCLFHIGENHPEERDPSLSDEDAHVHDGVISKARANQPKIEKTAIDMLNDTGGQYGDRYR